MFKAVNQKSTELAQLLIDEGAEVNVKNEDGETPIFHAIRRNAENLTKILIENGANLNLQNSDGKSPLDIARKNGNQKIIDFLKT